MAGVEVDSVKRQLLFEVGPYLFSVEAQYVREVLEPCAVTPVPGAATPVVGLINIRGTIIKPEDIPLDVLYEDEWLLVVNKHVDRIRSAQGVVDFLDFGLGNVRWPVFNIADTAVTIGAVLLLASLWAEESPRRSDRQPPVRSFSSGLCLRCGRGRLLSTRPRANARASVFGRGNGRVVLRLLLQP